MQEGRTAVHSHFSLDTLNVPVMATSVAAFGWMDWLWLHLPGPTALYMAISAAFMLFQMCDKLGLLNRFKRYEMDDAPEVPEHHERK